MHAIRQHEHGGPDVLRWEEVPDPEPGPGQVRVAVEAAGVHLLDTSIRAGETGGPFPPPELPMTPGREVAGKVDGLGPDADPSWLGRRVVVHLGMASGGYAERAVADQDALFAVMGYQFTRRFSLYAGINGSPGTRSLQGSHPFWLGHDRVMADEFFRPYFAFGTWAQGEVVPGFWYNAFVGNNSSSLGIKATQLDRTMSAGASVWWMPTSADCVSVSL